MTAGERIRRIREEKGLTQTDLAKLAGYTDKTSISKIENAGDNISTKTAIRIAKALNCDYKEIFGWTMTMEIAKPPTEAELETLQRAIAYMGILTNYQRELLDKISELSDEAKDRIMHIVDYEYKQEMKKHE